jgi:hypothetical protein
VISISKAAVGVARGIVGGSSRPSDPGSCAVIPRPLLRRAKFITTAVEGRDASIIFAFDQDVVACCPENVFEDPDSHVPRQAQEWRLFAIWSSEFLCSVFNLTLCGLTLHQMTDSQ